MIRVRIDNIMDSMRCRIWILWLNRLLVFYLSLTLSLFWIGDSIKIIWIPRRSYGPWGSIWGGGDGSINTHYNKGAICVGDSKKISLSPWIPWSPGGSNRWGKDVSWIPPATNFPELIVEIALFTFSQLFLKSPQSWSNRNEKAIKSKYRNLRFIRNSPQGQRSTIQL